MTDDDAQTDPARARRDATYMVFEKLTVTDERDGKRVGAWTLIATRVKAPTDSHAILEVIGTHDEPVEGFDAKRRMLPHWAVLVRDYRPRERKAVTTEDWA